MHELVYMQCIAIGAAVSIAGRSHMKSRRYLKKFPDMAHEEFLEGENDEGLPWDLTLSHHMTGLGRQFTWTQHQNLLRKNKAQEEISGGENLFFHDLSKTSPCPSFAR